MCCTEPGSNAMDVDYRKEVNLADGKDKEYE